jgi:hypothetical protein
MFSENKMSCTGKDSKLEFFKSKVKKNHCFINSEVISKVV